MKTFQTEFIFRLSKTEISICPKKLSPTTDNRPPKRQIRRICLFSVFPNFLIYFNPLFVYPFTHLSLKSEKPQQAAAAAVAAAAGGEFFSGGFFPSKIRIEWKSCFAFCLFWNVAIDRMWLFLFSFVLSFCRERLRIKIEIVEKIRVEEDDDDDPWKSSLMHFKSDLGRFKLKPIFAFRSSAASRMDPAATCQCWF